MCIAESATKLWNVDVCRRKFAAGVKFVKAAASTAVSPKAKEKLKKRAVDESRRFSSIR